MPVFILKALGAATAALGWMPDLGSIGHGLKVATYLLVLAGGAWGGVKASNWWHSDKITIEASNQRCADAISVATIEARESAVVEREAALNERAIQVDVDEALLKIAIEKMEKDRAESGAGGNSVLVRSDDEWLQRWRGGNPAGGGGGRPGGDAVPRAGTKGPR